MTNTSCRFVPFHLLEGTPHVMVDGRGNADTALTLSHWPASATPPQFKGDLSAEIVFNFIESGARLPDGVTALTNNHFDEDGLVSLFALLHREEALENKDFLIDVARAGDFSKFEDRDAARVSSVISAWTDPDRSPLNRTVFGGTHDDLNAVLYEELLDRLPSVIDKIGHFESFWRADDLFLDKTEEALEKGQIEVSENEEIDLAVIVIPDGGIHGQGRPPEHAASWISSVCHPMAIHNRINCHRVLVMQGRRYEFYYRYETWVDFVSSKLLARVDLSRLVERLNAIERNPRWKFTGVDDIIGRLKPRDQGDSRVSPNQFLAMLTEELKSDRAT